MPTEPAGREPSYAALIARLVAFRETRLRGLPSDRAIAKAAGVSPTTIGKWLRDGQFPQQIDPLLTLVRAVRAQAERVGVAGGQAEAEAEAVLDPGRWRRAYLGEARRRADATGTAVEAEQARAALRRLRPGRPLSEVTDPFTSDLEVHRAIRSPVAGLPALPAYVPREHDRALAEAVAHAANGTSRIVVLVGGSSTGKTRACWEALHPLRARDEPWRLWHPLDPTRPDAALAGLNDLAPYTVVWLNEAQFYLTPDAVGERVAAGLRTLLHNQPGPVLVLATLWPDQWDTLTTRAVPDRHAQTRELLDGHSIRVPDAFSGVDLATLADTAGRDPRLREAATHARDGRIAQYLAGGPALLDRYENAPPATRALIDTAIDALRLGAGPHIPLTWLTEAAPGYLTDSEWNQTDDDWVEQALDYITTPCHGTPGILLPVKTGTNRNQRATGPAAGHGPGASGPSYRLADYLHHHGRRHRAETIPPIAFWTAGADHAHPADLTVLGNAAMARGLFRDAAQLRKRATAHGDPHAAAALVDHMHRLSPADHRPAQYAAAHVSLDDVSAVVELLNVLERRGAGEQAAALAQRAATQTPLDNPRAVAGLLHHLTEVGAQEQAAVLAERAALHTPLDDPSAVAELLNGLREAGAREHTASLAQRAATHSPVDDPHAVVELLNQLTGPETPNQAAALAQRATAHAPLDNPRVVRALLTGLRQVWEPAPAAAFAEHVAKHAPLDDPCTVVELLAVLRDARAQEQVATLLSRNPAAHVSLDDPSAVGMLLAPLGRAGSREQAAALAQRAALHAPVDNPGAVASLLADLQQVCAQEELRTLAERAATHAHLDNLDAAAALLHGLVEVGAHEQAAAFAERAAAHVPVDDPRAVATLLLDLRMAGAQDQSEALARRAAARTPVDRPVAVAVAEVLRHLVRAGAREQAATLAQEAAVHTPLDNPYDVARVLVGLVSVGARDEAATLSERAAAHAPLDDPAAVSDLLDALEACGAHEHTAALLTRDPAEHVRLDEPSAVAVLLQRLHGAGTRDQAAALAERAAAHAPLDSAAAVTDLLVTLQICGTQEQVATLLARDPAARVSLHDPPAVNLLLDLLQNIGQHGQAAALAERQPGAGQFDDFATIGDRRKQFTFGREPDGRAALRWSWDDLR
ncbi:hypothetical protein ACFVZH_28310 [Streptomyces sp. NPDC059534]|uniref:hypothetical protein n=1 Tax=Streptomyces sp. NPDC059534 TaxID=3346859 RepID=UPI00368CDCE3